MKKLILFLLGCGCWFAAPTGAQAQLLINGAGATFPYPIYSKWFDEYAKRTRRSASTTNPSAPAAGKSKSSPGRWTSARPTAR